MYWLGLLPYVFTGRPVYVQTAPDGNWSYGQIILALPDLIIVRASSSESCEEHYEVYQESNIYVVKESHPGIDRERLARLVNDEGDGEDRKPVHK